MGESSNYADVKLTLEALDDAFASYGVKLKANLATSFERHYTMS